MHQHQRPHQQPPRPGHAIPSIRGGGTVAPTVYCLSGEARPPPSSPAVTSTTVIRLPRTSNRSPKSVTTPISPCCSAPIPVFNAEWSSLISSRNSSITWRVSLTACRSSFFAVSIAWCESLIAWRDSLTSLRSSTQKAGQECGQRHTHCKNAYQFRRHSASALRPLSIHSPCPFRRSRVRIFAFPSHGRTRHRARMRCFTASSLRRRSMPLNVARAQPPPAPGWSGGSQVRST